MLKSYVTGTLLSGADPGGGQLCLGHGQIFGKLVLLLVFGCGPTSGDTVRFVGWIRPWLSTVMGKMD